MSVLLPQLDASTYSSQIFWLLVTFSILYFALSRIFLPNIIDLIHKRKQYIDGVREKISEEEETIADMHERHAVLIASKNDEVSKKIKNANTKANEIIAENNELLSKSVNAMHDEMIGNLLGNLEAKKYDLQIDCQEILMIFNKKFNTNPDAKNLDTEAIGVFEKLWFREFKKLKS
jgi:F-type H+-transporting ATPase subunit b